MIRSQAWTGHDPSRTCGAYDATACVSVSTQIEASLCQGPVLGRFGARRVDPLSIAGWTVIIVAVGPGTDLSEVPVSGFNPAALDYRVAPECRPGPTVNAGGWRRFGVDARQRRRSCA
jgi:hypothetical protein